MLLVKFTMKVSTLRGNQTAWWY